MKITKFLNIDIEPAPPEMELQIEMLERIPLCTYSGILCKSGISVHERNMNVGCDCTRYRRYLQWGWCYIN